MLPRALVADTQSVKNTSACTANMGINGGKLVKGRKRFFLTDTLGNVVWVKVVPANEYDDDRRMVK